MSHEAPEVFCQGKIGILCNYLDENVQLIKRYYLITGRKSGSQSDMYSFGMVVHELLQPKYKYPWESVYDGARSETINILIVEAVKRGERPPVPAFKELTYRGAVDIMKECWVQNPEKRPTAKEVQNKLLILVYTLLHFYNY